MVSTLGRSVGAILLAALLSIAAFTFLGVLLPAWIMIAIHGRQAVEDSPAHGAAVMFISLPLAGVVSLLAFILLVIWLYQKFSFSK